MFIEGFGGVNIQRDTSIRATIPLNQSVSLILSGLPGLQIARDGSSYMDPESCALTFQVLDHLCVKSIFLLMEDHELPESSKDTIEQAAQKLGVRTFWFPIRDFDIPNEEFTSDWLQTGPFRKKSIDNGDSICLACLYGAGRSGMMAAALLREYGHAPKDAVSHLRTHYSEAVGNKKQELWVAGDTFLPR